MGKEHKEIYFDRRLNKFVGLNKLQLKKAYKDKDVDRELLKMGLWLQSGKGREYSPGMPFIMSWLDKAQPTQRSVEDEDEDEHDNVLRPILNSYLQELWHGKEALLAMNLKTA